MRRTKVVNKIRTELKKFIPEAEVILYGSEARGDARIDSDFDLLILLPTEDEPTRFVKKRSEISSHLFELALQLEVEISTLVLPRAIWETRHTPFTANVRKDGIRI